MANKRARLAGLLTSNPKIAEQVAVNNAVLGGLLGVGDEPSAMYPRAVQARRMADLGGLLASVVPAESAASLGAKTLGGLAAIFAGKGAKIADLVKMDKAQKMLSAGADPAQVWRETGWARGPDGQMRFEIPDDKARMSGFDPSQDIIEAFKQGGVDAATARRAELADYVRPYQRSRTQDIESVYEHPQLSDAYPDLFHYGKYQYDAHNPIIGEGSYSSASPGSGYAYDLVKLSPANEQTAASVMAHELQHAIQKREGFASGGGPQQMAAEWMNAKKDQDFYSTIDALAREADRAYGGNVDKAAGALNDIGIEVTPEHIQELMRIGAKGAAYKSEKAQNVLKSFGGVGQYGDPGMNLYQRLAGEAEARLTQHRLNLTPEQRASQYPFDPAYFQEATGVPLGSLLFR